MDVDITKNDASLECIRCGECVKACPVHAIDTKLMLMNNEIAKSGKVAAAKAAAVKTMQQKDAANTVE